MKSIIEMGLTRLEGEERRTGERTGRVKNVLACGVAMNFAPTLFWTFRVRLTPLFGLRAGLIFLKPY